MFPKHSNALAPEIATITASLNLIPQEWRIDVLLFVNKLIAKHNAITKICPYQNNCRFQKLCWYQHPTPTTHDPYATSACFSSRNRAPRDSASNFDQIKPQNVSLPGTLLPSASTALGPTNIYSPHHPPPPQPSTSAAAPCKQPRSRRSSSTTASSSVEFTPLAGAQAESHHAAHEHRNSSDRKTPPEITSSHQDEPQSDTSSSSVKSGKWTLVCKKPNLSDYRARQPCVDGENERTCKDCRATFTQSEDTKNWYLARGLHIPLRCEACRLRRKLQTTPEEKKPTPAKIIIYQPSPPTGKKWATDLTAPTHFSGSNNTHQTVEDPVEENEDALPSESHSASATEVGSRDFEEADCTAQRSNSITNTATEAELDDPEDHEIGTNFSSSTPISERDDDSDDESSQSTPVERRSSTSSMPQLQDDSSDSTENNTPSIQDWHFKDPRLRRKLQATLNSPHKAILLNALNWTNEQMKETVPYSARHADLLLRRFKFAAPQ